MSEARLRVSWDQFSLVAVVVRNSQCKPGDVIRDPSYFNPLRKSAGVQRVRMAEFKKIMTGQEGSGDRGQVGSPTR